MHDKETNKMPTSSKCLSRPRADTGAQHPLLQAVVGLQQSWLLCTQTRRQRATVHDKEGVTASLVFFRDVFVCETDPPPHGPTTWHTSLLLFMAAWNFKELEGA